MRGLGRRRRGRDGRGHRCRGERDPAGAEEIPGPSRDQYDQRRKPERERREQGTLWRLGGFCFAEGLCLGRNADLKRVDPDRLSDILELGEAEIADCEIEPPFDLPIGVLGQTDSARLANALQSRGDVDAVAHEVAVGLLYDVAEVNADAELDAAL